MFIAKSDLNLLFVVMAKLKLDSTSAFEAFFNDAYLLGIISSQREYQLCWQINRALDFHFRLNSDLELKMPIPKKEKICFFQIYEFSEPISYTLHYIYSNHFKGEFLIPELKNIDYLWLIKGDYYRAEEIDLLKVDLRRLKSVQMVTQIDALSLKSRANLIV